MDEVDRQRLSFEFRQDDPERLLAHGLGALIMQHLGDAHTLAYGGDRSLGCRDREAGADRLVDQTLFTFRAKPPHRSLREEIEADAGQWVGQLAQASQNPSAAKPPSTRLPNVVLVIMSRPELPFLKPAAAQLCRVGDGRSCAEPSLSQA